MDRPLSKSTLLAAIAFGIVWLGSVAQWVWVPEWPMLIALRPWFEALIFALGALAAAALVWQAWHWRMSRRVAAFVALSFAYVLAWQAALYGADVLVWDKLRGTLATMGIGGLFLIGLAWVVWLVDRGARRHELRRIDQDVTSRTWHPLDPAAWFYGRRSPKLNQSLTTLFSYSIAFFLIVTLLSQTRGCASIYESPAGGGKQVTVTQTVRIEKIIRKKFVVNPFSAISFEVPPIDEVKLQLNEVTAHQYTLGYGEGEGAGFAGGTSRGKVRFIRLEYTGGDWDQDFGVGGDLNMLLKYHEVTSHKIADETEAIKISQLASFPIGKSPPFVYMTGQQNISLSNNEVKTLREYVQDKHGMLFCDNGGSGHFHNQFLQMMQKVLPDVRPVPIPLDDRIHRQPNVIPFLPYVAPHGGKEALGWWKDGRWVAYYHPGDIGDAWSDGNAGVDPEVWKACYDLGVNVMFYAHAEYAKWNQARTKGK